jgi:hypothetical protein
MDGTKTQTRRLVKPGETDNIEIALELASAVGGGLRGVCEIDTVYTGWDNHRIKWQVGKTYAIQPGRTTKAIGRIRITEIRQERLWDMTVDDALDEGVFAIPYSALSVRFAKLWDTIHTKPGTRYDDNPEVWVLEFELVKRDKSRKAVRG